jgi:hypothetical protein
VGVVNRVGPSLVGEEELGEHHVARDAVREVRQVAGRRELPRVDLETHAKRKEEQDEQEARSKKEKATTETAAQSKKREQRAS